MAEVIGNLRPECTSGEKKVLQLLRQNLPKEYTVYVETPIRKRREIRYPDFVILTNYGVIVLEVKDWVYIEHADPHSADIRTRDGKPRHEGNPVTAAREIAITLMNEIESQRKRTSVDDSIPWGYAVVLPNLSPVVITQLYRAWGEDFVFSLADLQNPDILCNRIKRTISTRHIRVLTRQELDLVRVVINPVVDIEIENRPRFILDEQQEKIVAEPVRAEPAAAEKKPSKHEQAQQQDKLFNELTPAEQEEEALPQEGQRIIQNVAIRLVRGFSGSGKTLVLIQRARYLSAQYPEWNILVLTYNKNLQLQFEQILKSDSIKPQTFHSLCHQLLRLSKERETRIDNWIDQCADQYPIINKLGKKFVIQEIDWLRDLGISSLGDYLKLDRKGIGKEGRLLVKDREAVFSVYQGYHDYLGKETLWDYNEMPLLVLEAIEKGSLTPPLYDAILIDEAQDWAPVWFKVINHLIEPEHGLIFLADDPSQSIYRSYSWKEKGIQVVGRTRWLRVPYRNTYEIYQAAYSLIANNAEIQQSLKEEGELITPQISSQTMRHGPKPLLRKHRSTNDEVEYIRDLVAALRQQGYSEKQIAILVKYKSDIVPIEAAIRGSGVAACTIQSYKGLEMDAVILPHIHKTFTPSDEETAMRRLMYMAMSRARSALYLTCSGKLPHVYEELYRQGLVDYME